MSIGRSQQRTHVALYGCLWFLLFSSYLFLPWFPLLADSNFTGCGGAIVTAQNATYEAEVAALVNQQRAAVGLPPMKLVPDLSNAARYHAADMADDNYFSHPTQDRVNDSLVQVCSWSDRIKSFYTGSSGLGENIAWGYASPQAVMDGWMASPGHRDNILGNYAEIGVGYLNSRWVQDFGTRRSQTQLIINREALQTFIPEVTLYIHGDGLEMRLRNDDQPWSEWQTFQAEINWVLQNVSGERQVNIEVRRNSGTVAGSDTIILNSTASVTATPVPAVPTATSVPAVATATPVLPTPTAAPVQPTAIPTAVILPPNMNERVYLPVVTQ
jgi:hypothetical protein